MIKYYYLYSTELKRGVNVKYSASGALILYAKQSSAQRALDYALRHKHSEYFKEMSKTLIIKEVEL
jgi:hypothetical protein